MGTTKKNTTYVANITVASIVESNVNDTSTTSLTIIATKKSMALYIDIELEALKNSINKSDIHKGVKNSLFSKIDDAIKKKEQGLSHITEKREKQANNMLNACENVINSFINEVKAQKGKNVPDELASEWIVTAGTIINHLNTTIETPIEN